MKTSVIILLGFLFCTLPSTTQDQLRERESSKLTSGEPQPLITVTIALDWDRHLVPKPIPPSYTTTVPKGTFLVKIMNIAADEDKKGPFNKYTSTYYGGLGHFITSIYEIEQDPSKDIYWMIYDKGTGQKIPLGVDDYQPQDGSTTIFRYENIRESPAEEELKQEL